MSASVPSSPRFGHVASTLQTRLTIVLALALASGPLVQVARWAVERFDPGTFEIPLFALVVLVFAAVLCVAAGGGYVLARVLLSGVRSDSASICRAGSADELRDALSGIRTTELVAPFEHVHRTFQQESGRVAGRVTYMAALVHDLKARLAGLSLVVNADGSMSQEDLSIVSAELASLQAWLARVLEVVRLDQVDRLSGRADGSLRPLVEEAVRRAAAADGLPVATFVEGDAVAKVDPAELERAFLNLVANARRAARQRVVVQIFPGLVRIVDDGRGLPVAFDDLTEPFVRGSGPTQTQTRTTSGTGLGLYVARRILELHGGRLVCERSDDRGTTLLAYIGL